MGHLKTKVCLILFRKWHLAPELVENDDWSLNERQQMGWKCSINFSATFYLNPSFRDSLIDKKEVRLHQIYWFTESASLPNKGLRKVKGPVNKFPRLNRTVIRNVQIVFSVKTFASKWKNNKLWLDLTFKQSRPESSGKFPANQSAEETCWTIYKDVCKE